MTISPTIAWSFRRGLPRSLRRELIRVIDSVEVVFEQFATRASQEDLDEIVGVGSSSIHSLNMSVGRADGIDTWYVEQVRAMCDRIDATFCSDHLALTTVGGLELGHLSPVELTDDSLSIVCANVAKAQEMLDRPLLLENISRFFGLPSDRLSEAEFLGEVARRTGCGILLDLHNLYVNQRNLGASASEWVTLLAPLSASAVHLAGGSEHDGWMFDSHDEPVPESVFLLLREVLVHPGGGSCTLPWSPDPVDAPDVVLRDYGIAPHMVVRRCGSEQWISRFDSLDDAITHHAALPETLLYGHTTDWTGGVAKTLEIDLGLPSGQLLMGIFSGGARSGLNTHFDPNESITVQVSGEKHWRIWPYHCVGGVMYPFTTGRTQLNNFGDARLHSRPSGEFIDVVMQPGSVLYLPAGMWHATEAADASVSINFLARRLTPYTVLEEKLRASLLPNSEWRSSLDSDGLLRLNAALEVELPPLLSGLHASSLGQGSF